MPNKRSTSKKPVNKRSVSRSNTGPDSRLEEKDAAAPSNALNLTITQDTLELLLKAQANYPYILDLSETLEMIVFEYDRSLAPVSEDGDTGLSGSPVLH